MTAASKTAVVLGANGQDGTFLTRSLLARGHRVVGIGRQPLSRWENGSAFSYRSMDLRDGDALAGALGELAPDFIFHAAAVHANGAQSAGDYYETQGRDMLAVNVATVHAALEYARTNKPEAHLLYISSGKVFGPDFPERVDEQTPKKASCLYTVTKLAAEDLIHYYRRKHQLTAAIVYTFGHESPLRPDDFFIPKLVAVLGSARRGEKTNITFQSLDFYADWGAAPEYMDICVDIAERGLSDDLILASGHNWHGRDFSERLFARFGLDYRDWIVETASFPAARPFVVDVGALEARLGRRPRENFLDYVAGLAETDAWS